MLIGQTCFFCKKASSCLISVFLLHDEGCFLLFVLFFSPWFCNSPLCIFDVYPSRVGPGRQADVSSSLWHFTFSKVSPRLSSLPHLCQGCECACVRVCTRARVWCVCGGLLSLRTPCRPRPLTLLLPGALRTAQELQLPRPKAATIEALTLWSLCSRAQA